MLRGRFLSGENVTQNTSNFEPTMQSQLSKPPKVQSCGTCHQKEWKQENKNNSMLWVRAHPASEHGAKCQNLPCTSLKHCKLPSCKYQRHFNFTYLLDHPLEVEEKAKQKELKRKTKENETKEKEARKKQKKDQKIGNSHFSEFVRAKGHLEYVIILIQ